MILYSYACDWCGQAAAADVLRSKQSWYALVLQGDRPAWNSVLEVTRLDFDRARALDKALEEGAYHACSRKCAQALFQEWIGGSRGRLQRVRKKRFAAGLPTGAGFAAPMEVAS